MAERLRARFSAAPVIYAGAEIKVTASFGATVFSEMDANFEATLKRADGALYEAKSRRKEPRRFRRSGFRWSRFRQSPRPPARIATPQRGPISVPSTIKICVGAPAIPKSLSLIRISLPSAVSDTPSILPG